MIAQDKKIDDLFKYQIVDRSAYVEAMNRE